MNDLPRLNPHTEYASYVWRYLAELRPILAARDDVRALDLLPAEPNTEQVVAGAYAAGQVLRATLEGSPERLIGFALLRIAVCMENWTLSADDLSDAAEDWQQLMQIKESLEL